MPQRSFNTSVIIPAYNAAHFLRECVNSALQHEYVKEIIIVDDGSTDNTWAVCEELSHLSNRIRIFNHGTQNGLHINKGVSVSRNLGISQAKCEYIAFLDADDLYTPNRFNSEIAAAAAFEFSQGTIASFNNSPEEIIPNTLHGISSSIPLQIRDSLCGYRFQGTITLNTVTLTKKIEVEHDISFNETLRLNEDIDFMIRYLHFCRRIIYTQEITALRRLHQASTTESASPFMRRNYLPQRLMYLREIKNFFIQEKIDRHRSAYIRNLRRAYEIAMENNLTKARRMFVSYFLKDPRILMNYIRFKKIFNLTR